MTQQNISRLMLCGTSLSIFLIKKSRYILHKHSCMSLHPQVFLLICPPHLYHEVWLAKKHLYHAIQFNSTTKPCLLQWKQSHDSKLKRLSTFDFLAAMSEAFTFSPRISFQKSLSWSLPDQNGPDQALHSWAAEQQFWGRQTGHMKVTLYRKHFCWGGHKSCQLAAFTFLALLSLAARRSGDTKDRPANLL